MIGTALTGLFSAREGTHIDLVTPGFRVGETNQHRGVRLTGYHSPPPAPPAPDELQDLHREVPPRVAPGRPAQTGIEPGEHVTLFKYHNKVRWRSKKGSRRGTAYPNQARCHLGERRLPRSVPAGTPREDRA